MNSGIGAIEERYFTLMAERGWSPANLRFYLDFIFDGVELAHANILDVGAGDGRDSLYAAAKGAKSVVGLEPEAAGSSGGVRDAFLAGASTLGLEQVTLVVRPLQEYATHESAFDLVWLDASINHLDESACIRLQHDPDARAIYADLFAKLAALSAPGARLIAVDCSSRNFFARFGRNPFVPAIEWQKHQPPEFWADLLVSAGFGNPRIRWHSFNTLRSFGQLVLGNQTASYFLTSSFCLTMERASPVPAHSDYSKNASQLVKPSAVT